MWPCLQECSQCCTSVDCRPEMCGHVFRNAHSVVHQWTVDQRCVAMSSGDAHSVVHQWTVDQTCGAMSSGDAQCCTSVDCRPDMCGHVFRNAHSVVHQWTVDQTCGHVFRNVHSVVHQWTVDCSNGNGTE